ncbi:enoyl-CoA hydratase/isomerase family protein [Motiliproteus coralliicola]|uniref:3-hydroxyisobutyryl-CoA hydrolase n=1 Tax=Motiliproteus coralliicola TaxID=2283196 RepID=A0A369WDT2_9GAMM|nr:enoyl-CoA hydratase/isomerase family protein [Motiliproteus coralliicola]RDE19453.1 enoyl-CoA hydratase/isomerase family protein [Motiliproteus coralliicola]
MTAILFTEHAAANGKKIIQATLNSEKSLNALTLEMIELLAPKLPEWEADEAVAAVILDGAGDKAFCAGGDIRNLYKGMVGDNDNPDFVETFFTEEYQLDHAIHCFTKPLIVWGGGIVMGGGLGLMAGANYRVVTETSRIAMPEVSIGLYPDVGGSWFLNRMPGRVGLFLGLTASGLNAADCRYVGLGDRFVSTDKRGLLIEQLQAVEWGSDLEDLHHGVNTVLRQLEQDSLEQLPESQVLKHFDTINALMDHYELKDIVAAILALETDDRWLQKAQGAVKAGSPAAMALIFAQLKRSKHLSLKEVFQAELVLSLNCGKAGEFAEGVRALLIDKDGKPDWRFKSLETVDQNWIEGLFVSPWSDADHPLAQL